MRHLRYAGVNVFLTLLRVLPFPCRTGLVSIGRPGRDAPVLMTGNFRLTVERLKRALEGLDAYLLVANSRGVNVWCAATGGLLTHHDVVSVLKTSGIEDRVDHRQVILPQLAATGIEARLIQEKSGWRVVWGPVEAAAIPEFLRRGQVKTPALRTVSFGWPRRLEMAVAWAFPISLVALLGYPLWGEALVPLWALIWALSLLIFLSFPLYEGQLRIREKRVGWVFFDFGPRGVTLLLGGAFLAVWVAWAFARGDFSWELVARWALASLVVVSILSLDLTGSTPVYKSGLHEDRLLQIALDRERCKGAALCEQVCPTDVLEVDDARRLATLAREERCVQCGACIVQCPFDALYFRTPTGGVVTADTVRTFKLNLLGRRLVRPG